MCLTTVVWPKLNSLWCFKLRRCFPCILIFIPAYKIGIICTEAFLGESYATGISLNNQTFSFFIKTDLNSLEPSNEYLNKDIILFLFDFCILFIDNADTSFICSDTFCVNSGSRGRCVWSLPSAADWDGFAPTLPDQEDMWLGTVCWCSCVWPGLVLLSLWGKFKRSEPNITLWISCVETN